MSIKIGDNNKIKNSIIIEKNNSKTDNKEKISFANRHPILIGIVCSIIASIIMMFPLWDNIVELIKKLF